MAEDEASTEVDLTLVHHGKPVRFTLPAAATISDLSDAIATDLSIPPSYQKFLITGLKPSLQKPPFQDPSLPISLILGKKIQLLGSTPAEVNALSSAKQELEAAKKRRDEARVKYSARPSRYVDRQTVQDDAKYAFHAIKPLMIYPDPERSQKFLERLAADPGIKAAMRRHKFSVGLLTEMDPTAHTNHSIEGVERTLGLNRNKGEVIELRLRTDAYDGYRDYKTIRKTLCHELTHNVFSEHDSSFWSLCGQIEKEVERDDWTRGGHQIKSKAMYEPDEVVGDQGAVIGGGKVGDSGDSGIVNGEGLSRREAMARAAEERAKKLDRSPRRDPQQGE